MGLLRWPFIAIAALAGGRANIGAWAADEKGSDYAKVIGLDRKIAMNREPIMTAPR
jgi:hypothetical protein